MTFEKVDKLKNYSITTKNPNFSLNKKEGRGGGVEEKLKANTRNQKQ